METDVLGVDIGGVIIDRANDHSETSFFSPRYLEATPEPGVFEALRHLVDGRFGENVYLVSKCGEKTAARSRRWLDQYDFYAKTGILPTHVRFCREHADKAPICRDLGVTHFVDDRLEVLSQLPFVRTLMLFRPRKNDVEKFAQYYNWVEDVASWQEVEDKLLSRAH